MAEQNPDEILFFDSEPVVAYRVWELAMVDGEPEALRSITYRVRWPKRKPMRAHCVLKFGAQHGRQSPGVLHRSHAPEQGHTCGIYALKNEEGTKQWSTVSWPVEVVRFKVVGVVALWGRVLRHEEGYRAEYGYPQLIHPLKDTDLNEWMESAYGVEVA